MWTTVRQVFRSAPVTASIIFICSALLAWTFYLVLFEDLNYAVAQEQLGVPLGYTMPAGGAGPERIDIGPIKIWDGQWWRVLIAGLHHGNSLTGGIVHLVLNCLGLWYLGQLLEYRIGSLRMALLFAVSLVVSILAEILVGTMAVGISGAICAVFGYLLVLRDHDRYILEMLPAPMVRFMLISLVVFIPLTYFKVLPVANLAHFSGLAYGYLAGRVAFAGSTWRIPARAVFGAAHLLIPLGLYFAVHPVWNATYHWHLGSARTLSRQERIMHLRQAVAIDPRLDPVWVELSEQYLRTGNRHDAWIAILQGVHNNPSSTSALRHATLVGLSFRTSQERKLARQLLDEVFDDDAPEWADRLLAQAPAQPLKLPPFLPGNLPQYRFGDPVDLQIPTVPDPKPQDQRLPPPDPGDPNSAAVGTAT